MNIEAGAKVLAKLMRQNYDDMQEGYIHKEFTPIIYSTTGGIKFQGRKEDIKLMVAEIIKAVFELDKLPESFDEEA